MSDSSEPVMVEPWTAEGGYESGRVGRVGSGRTYRLAEMVASLRGDEP